LVSGTTQARLLGPAIYEMWLGATQIAKLSGSPDPFLNALKKRVFVAFAGPQPNGKPVKVVCKTNATATDGRSGISKLDDGSFEINSVPFGRKTEGVNPEQLFALG